MKRAKVKRSKGILVAGLSLLAALGTGEVLARLLIRQEAPIRLDQFVKVVTNQHKVDFGQVFEPDPELFWRLRPEVVLPDDARPLFGRISNRQGFRKTRDTELEKPTGTLRILFLGDSCTFGYLVGCEDTVAENVEHILGKRRPDLKVECLNAGVPGYTIYQCWRFLERHGLAFQPDLVVIQSGWNEATPWDGLGDLEQAERMRNALPPALAWSRLACFLERVMRPDAASAGGEKRPRLRREEFRGLLERVREATRGANAELLVLVAPCESNLEGAHVRTEYQVEQYAFGASSTLGPAGPSALLDGAALIQNLSRRTPRGEMFFDSVHTTAAANRRMAQVLAERVEAWRPAASPASGTEPR